MSDSAAFTPPPRWNPATDLAKYDAILFDCDGQWDRGQAGSQASLSRRLTHCCCVCAGVLWHESSAIPGAVATLKALQEQGKQLLFATNNSGKSREDYMKKFPELGFDFKLTAVSN